MDVTGSPVGEFQPAVWIVFCPRHLIIDGRQSVLSRKGAVFDKYRKDSFAAAPYLDGRQRRCTNLNVNVHRIPCKRDERPD